MYISASVLWHMSVCGSVTHGKFIYSDMPDCVDLFSPDKHQTSALCYWLLLRTINHEWSNIYSHVIPQTCVWLLISLRWHPVSASFYSTNGRHERPQCFLDGWGHLTVNNSSSDCGPDSSPWVCSNSHFIHSIQVEMAVFILRNKAKKNLVKIHSSEKNVSNRSKGCENMLPLFYQHPFLFTLITLLYCDLWFFLSSKLCTSEHINVSGAPTPRLWLMTGSEVSLLPLSPAFFSSSLTVRRLGKDSGVGTKSAQSSPHHLSQYFVSLTFTWRSHVISYVLFIVFLHFVTVLSWQWQSRSSLDLVFGCDGLCWVLFGFHIISQYYR